MHWRMKEFYVDPHANKLLRVDDFPSLRATKGMTTEQVRAYREEEQRLKLEDKRIKKAAQLLTEEQAKEVLKKSKQNE
jgi:hypothetical protein